MTGVYSGGLVYEYSEEGSKYGLVTIDGDDVTEGDDFTALKTAFAGTTNPSGDGGYSCRTATKSRHPGRTRRGGRVRLQARKQPPLTTIAQAIGARTQPQLSWGAAP